MTVRLTIPRLELRPRRWHRMIPIPALPRARRPRVYRCEGAARAHFFREVAPGHWEMANEPTFALGFPIPDRTRAAIEARGHVLVPIGGHR
ncbi:hypothetical protein [Amycolatopsis thermoflava]|uniref:hypothetical protein n=1 Tax=Amycolatopsis thermoflava TaxID=84480 RepID=UPI003F4A4102